MDTDPHESFKDQLPFEEYLLHGQELGKRRKFLDAISKETEESLSVCFEKIKKGIVTLVGVPFYHSKEVFEHLRLLSAVPEVLLRAFIPNPTTPEFFSSYSSSSDVLERIKELFDLATNSKNIEINIIDYVFPDEFVSIDDAGNTTPTSFRFHLSLGFKADAVPTRCEDIDLEFWRKSSQPVSLFHLFYLKKFRIPPLFRT